MTRILVVEDEPAYRDPLCFRLEQEGFTVDSAASGTEAVKQLRAAAPDLILLDLMLPGLSGMEVCKIARQETGAAVIIVSAKDEEVDKVVGLEMGADDYVTKPYSFRELLARVRAVLRRSGGEPAGETPANTTEEEETLNVGPLELDRAAHEVRLNGTSVEMPLREYELLEYLMENSGRVLTRAQLLGMIWGADFNGDPKTLDVHIQRLRGRLKGANLIRTVRGVGYKIQE